MKALYHQWLIDRRIACYEAGYPICEARFISIKEWILFKLKKVI